MGHRRSKGLPELWAKEANSLTPACHPGTPAQVRQSAPPQSQQDLFTGQPGGTYLSWVPIFGFQAPLIAMAGHSFQASSRWHCHQDYGQPFGASAAQLPWLRNSWTQALRTEADRLFPAALALGVLRPPALIGPGLGATVSASPCSLGLPGVKVTGGGGRWRIGPVSSWQRRPAGRGGGALVYKAPMALWPAEAGYRRHHGRHRGSAEGHRTYRAAAGTGGGE